MQKELDALTTDGTLDTYREFATADAAATEVLNAVTPLSEKYGLEIGGNIYESKNGYVYTKPKIGSAIGVKNRGDALGYHTHPGGRLRFSNAIVAAGNGTSDIQSIKATGYGNYLGVFSSGKTSIGFCDTTCKNFGFGGTRPKRILQ